MIVGNKSSGDGLRKVGIWDQYDINGRITLVPNEAIKNMAQPCLNYAWL